MKMTYGTPVTLTYDPEDPEHHARRDKKYVKPSGRVAVPDAFSPILQQVCVPLKCVAKESRRDTYATWV